MAVCLISCSSAFAQQDKGEVVVNCGLGYSPGFNGAIGLFSSPLYPVSYNTTYNSNFGCTSIMPNLGASIDYGFAGGTSLGLAASFQSEIVGTDYFSPVNNKITRTNGGLRVLYHINRTDKTVDPYFGMRFGFSYYTDDPTTNVPLFLYFLNNTSLLVPSFQLLYGMRFYIADDLGINFEIGLGSPYVAEIGLTLRLAKHKQEENNKTPTSTSK